MVRKINKKGTRKVNFLEVQRNHGTQGAKNYYINNKVNLMFHQNNHNLVHLVQYNQIINNLIQNQQANNKFIIQILSFL